MVSEGVGREEEEKWTQEKKVSVGVVGVEGSSGWWSPDCRMQRYVSHSFVGLRPQITGAPSQQILLLLACLQAFSLAQCTLYWTRKFRHEGIQSVRGSLYSLLQFARTRRRRRWISKAWRGRGGWRVLCVKDFDPRDPGKSGWGGCTSVP